MKAIKTSVAILSALYAQARNTHLFSCLSISITLGELPFQHTVHQRQTFACTVTTQLTSASQEYTVSERGNWEVNVCVCVCVYECVNVCLCARAHVYVPVCLFVCLRVCV